MGMTIEERIAQLVRIKHYASPKHYETLDVAIETMRKYQQIEEMVKQYKKFGNIDFSMQIISGVVEDGKND